VTREQQRRLYGEAGPLIDRLAKLPFAPITHHLLQTLEVFVEFDPRGVFLRIGAAIESGKAGGYQFETLAVTVFVRLVERYLAEHRTLIARDAEVRRALTEMLDVFLAAGWPEARQLTYGLQELFR
jgi:hypothetical protein